MQSNRQFLSHSAAALAATLLMTAGSVADCTPISLPPASTDDELWFGHSVAIGLYVDGTRDVMVGSPADDINSLVYAGSIAVYHFNGLNWALRQTIVAPTPENTGFFGDDVVIDDAIAATGSYNATGGKVYVMERDNQTGLWSTPLALTIPGLENMDGVGDHVAVQDSLPDSFDWLVTGAAGDGADLSLPVGEETANSGALHLFRRSTNGPWLYHGKFRRTAPTNALAANQFFGSSVAIRSNTLIAGAPNGELNAGENNSGVIMAYKVDTQGVWTAVSGNGYHHPLTASNDFYGSSVATYGGVCVVGAPRGDSTQAETPFVGAKTNCGYIEILLATTNGIQSAGRIFPPDASNNLGFGDTVSIGPLEIVVTTESDSGKAYVYRRASNGWDNWVLARILHHPGVGPNGFSGTDSTYGWIVAADYTTLGQSPEHFKGSVFLYETNQYTDPADTCARAAYDPLSAEGTYTGCSRDYTLGAYTTCGGTQANQGPDLFYAFKPRCTGPMIAETVGSSFDTVLSVHTACPPNVNPNNPNALTNTLACNDDIDIGAGITASRVIFNAVEGETYIFRIAGYNGAAGDYVFNFHAFNAPANDHCSQAQVVTAGVTPFVACGATTDGPTDQIICGIQPTNPHRDIWFRYTAPSSGMLTVDTCESNFSNVVQAFPGTVCPPTAASSITCSVEAPMCTNYFAGKIAFPVTGAADYLIRVASPNVEIFAATGYGSLNIRFTPARCPCDWNQNDILSVQDIFDFLASYFAGNADVNNSGATTVQDIFDFLACYFSGC